MHQTVDASLNSSNPVGVSRAPKVKTKFQHAMRMTFTTITGVAEVKIMALSAVISEDKKKLMKQIDDSFCCVVLNIFVKLSGGKNQFLI